MSEYLLCCAKTDIILCKRLNKNYNVFNEFQISKTGQNSYLSIINNVSSAILIFMNENSGRYDIYEYTIHPPKCRDISISIFVFQKFELNLYDYLENKVNNKRYFLILQTLPSDYGYILNNGERMSLNDKKELIDLENNFQFFSEKDKITNNFDIIYSISIEETYSATCKTL